MYQRSLHACTVIVSLFFVLLWISISSLPSIASSTDLQQIWAEARQGGRYTAPSDEELAQAEVLFMHLLEKKDHVLQTLAWQRLGFTLQEVEHKYNKYLVLHEHRDKKMGRGFFIFSLDAPSHSVLMAPHVYKDLGTDVIGLQVFLSHQFRAIAFNTVPRYHIQENGSKIHYDMGKLSQSYFAAFSTAFARLPSQGKLIQFHGFAQEKRTSPQGRQAGFILSGGTRNVRSDIYSLQESLQKRFAEKILIYAKDINELGGTTNISGKILRQYGKRAFIHIEMSKGVRDRLRDTPSFLDGFAQSLGEY